MKKKGTRLRASPPAALLRKPERRGSSGLHTTDDGGAVICRHRH